MARVLGADVYAHWTMGLVPLLLLTMIAPQRPALDSVTWTFIWSLAAAAVVWTHGLAHLWASGALAVGSGTGLLTPLAPIAHRAPPSPSARTELRAALAGPATHGLWALLAAAVLRVAPWGADAGSMVELFVWANVAVAAVNLLPFHPMDGGRVLRTLLARRLGRERAETWTATAGYGGAVVLGLAGLTLLLTGDETLVPWAMFLVVTGVLTLTASQRTLFSARFREFAPAPPPQPPRPPEPVSPVDLLRDTEFTFIEDADDDAQDEDDDGSTEHVVESAEERRGRLQERIDALLDRINEVGGLDGLNDDERRELAEASEMLRRETA